MTTLQEKIEVMQAFADGKEVEFRRRTSNHWAPTALPFWDWSNYEFRITPDKPMVIPWDHIHENFKWVAMDINGNVYLYESEPVLKKEEGVWVKNSESRAAYLSISVLKIDTGTVYWTDSLQKRP